MVTFSQNIYESMNIIVFVISATKSQTFLVDFLILTGFENTTLMIQQD